MRWMMTCVLAGFAFAGSGAGAARADAVTDWTLEADALGEGRANWRSLAIMHAAMHDALNAVEPVYRRWAPAERDEPEAVGADPQAALAAAAAEALRRLHPLHQGEIDRVFAHAMAALPDGGAGPAARAGVALGRAIGAAAARRREGDGFEDIRDFAMSDAAGHWRGAPPHGDAGLTNSIRPFLFPRRDAAGEVPPPALGSPAALADIAETRAWGGTLSEERNAAQTAAAMFWAYQSSQRGFVLLAGSLLAREYPSSGLAAHARVMAQLTAALADSAVLIWAEKERFLYWRPITAIRAGGPGWESEPDWTPLIETPGHPEYPSGHASDCDVGAGILEAVFGRDFGPVVYVSQSALPPREREALGREAAAMGQHEQPGGRRSVPRRFPTLAAAATECVESRIWAGAHFRSAEVESRRVADAIVAAALRSVPRD